MPTFNWNATGLLIPAAQRQRIERLLDSWRPNRPLSGESEFQQRATKTITIEADGTIKDADTNTVLGTVTQP